MGDKSLPNESKKSISPARARDGCSASWQRCRSFCCILPMCSTCSGRKPPSFFLLSLLPVILVYERSYATAALCFMASALLSWLLFPITDIWLLYVAFFGWYGILRGIHRVEAWPRLVLDPACRGLQRSLLCGLFSCIAALCEYQDSASAAHPGSGSCLRAVLRSFSAFAGHITSRMSGSYFSGFDRIWG